MSLREITPRYQLNTWASRYPAAVVDAVSGGFVLPVAYSAAEGSVSRADDPALVRLGRRRMDGTRLVMEFSHAGSTFRVAYGKPSPQLLLGELRAVRLGEWGLRTWLTLLACGGAAGLPSPEPAGAPEATADGRVRLHAPGRALALACASEPVYVTLHASLEAFESDIAGGGYYADGHALRAGAAPASAPVAAVRFNLEATPVIRFALALGADADTAAARAEAGARRLVALDAPAPPEGAAAPALAPAGAAAGMLDPDPEPEDDVDEALDAVATVMGWNAVVDPDNQRWYTVPTRAWVAGKFGGWFTWLDDTFFHAHLAATRDLDAARRNLEVAMSAATPEGNLACLLSPRTRWLDRSQSPIGGYVLLAYYLRSGDRAALHRYLPTLKEALAWWLRERRDRRTGLFAYGTSAYGHGAFAGTALAARDESFMDNSPLYDGVRLDPGTRRLEHVDVGLSSLIALEAEMLARAAAVVGDADASRALAATADDIRAAIETHLWNDEAGVYANLDGDGAFSSRLGPTSFYPLLAGAAAPERAERLVREQLLDAGRFWGRYAVPTIRRDDPAFGDDVYWRGRIWPPTNYLVYLGLRRGGFLEAASALADRSFAMFAAEWREHGHCHENYDAVTGQGCGGADSDPFYGWGALLPLMRVDEAVFPSPWEGLTVDVARGPCRSGVLWQGRTLRLSAGERPTSWRLSLAGSDLLAGDAACRLIGLEAEAGVLGCTVESRDGLELRFPGLPRDRVLHAALPEGIDLDAGPDGLRLRLPAGRHPLRLVLRGDGGAGTVPT
ncbi:MAG TPA: trehalase family glycosidase [Trueperaceae bacterium]|nr:trehalase family glycosidase [Trueperaceae bacterium]